MLSSFEKVFLDDGYDTKLPKAVLDTISESKLPSGFHYVLDDGGLCHLESIDGPLNFEFSFKNFDDEIRKKFEGQNNITFCDIYNYSYNSQKGIRIYPDKNGMFKINGENIQAENFVISAVDSVKLANGYFKILPPKFPEPYSIEVSGENTVMNLKMERKPYDSIYEMKNETVEGSPLIITLISSLSDELGVNISFSTKEIGRPQDILNAKKLYNDIVKGKGKILNKPIFVEGFDQKNLIDYRYIRFWERVILIEKKLGVEFNILEDPTFEDVYNIEALYKSLIENNAYKKVCKSFNLKSEGTRKEIEENIANAPKEAEMCFEFERSDRLHIFGQDISIYALQSIFGGRITKNRKWQNKKGWKLNSKIEPFDNKELYISTQYFLDLDSLKKERNKKNHLDKFQKANKIKFE